MLEQIKIEIERLLKKAGVTGLVNFTIPPNPEMGDLAFACFGLAKEWKKSPLDCAREIVEKLKNLETGGLIEKIEAIGPYANFYLNAQELAKIVLSEKKQKIIKKKEKIMVEFAHPNTHKPVHIGHLRTMTTGESMVRLFENQGHRVVRANYQGDVGMHIAKCLWGILQVPNYQTEISKLKTTSERAKFLGVVYANGGKAFESSEQVKKEIEALNAKIYSKDKSLVGLYKKTRKWSLDYFDYIYKRVGIKKFDRLYFESETFELGKKIVIEGIKSGIFKKSEGAVIFEGSKYGLHDRVFINSKGLPTYEAKDQALARMQFKEYNPARILHVVAKEQTEYFKVIFKALEFTLPESKGREEHLVYGWVSLKEGKMSSRTGNVVLAEWLLDEAEKKIAEVMLARKIKDKDKVIAKIAVAAVKYFILKTGTENDIVFDVNEAISLTGSSGPYLLYIVARINSILKKSKISNFKFQISNSVEPVEKKLLLELLKFEETIKIATDSEDPSQIARYLFDLAQAFNNFYQTCPVLGAEETVLNFRFQLIKKVKETMEKGLDLLGIETVEEM